MIVKYELYKESYENKYFYHGSTKDFDKFKADTCFFSTTKEFAEDYIDVKKMDFADDSDTIIYKVVFKPGLKIFDINNESDYEKLKSVLPEKNKIYDNFGFSAEIDKEDFLLGMKGYYIDKPLDFINDLKFGDLFPNPQYKSENYVVLKVDEDYVYYTFEESFENKFSSKIISRYYDDTKDIYNFLKNFIETNYSDEYKYISDEVIKKFYRNFRYTESAIKDYGKEAVEEFNVLFNEYKNKIIQKMFDDGGVPKYTRKERLVKLKDNWRYYENDKVEILLRELGYDGFKAVERNEITYAIFRPDLNVEIIEKLK